MSALTPSQTNVAKFSSFTIVHCLSEIKLSCVNSDPQPVLGHHTAQSLVWRDGNHGATRINDVTGRRARLVLGWVSVYGRANHIGIWHLFGQLGPYTSCASYLNSTGMRGGQSAAIFLRLRRSE